MPKGTKLLLTLKTKELAGAMNLLKDVSQVTETLISHTQFKAFTLKVLKFLVAIYIKQLLSSHAQWYIIKRWRHRTLSVPGEQKLIVNISLLMNKRTHVLSYNWGWKYSILSTLKFWTRKTKLSLHCGIKILTYLKWILTKYSLFSMIG